MQCLPLQQPHTKHRLRPNSTPFKLAQQQTGSPAIDPLGRALIPAYALPLSISAQYFLQQHTLAHN